MAGPTGIRSRGQQQRELVTDNELQLSALDQASLAISITGPIPQQRAATLWIASSRADLHAWIRKDVHHAALHGIPCRGSFRPSSEGLARATVAQTPPE